jgi:hypothetical protein
MNEPITSLKCAHYQVTIESLNDTVIYLMAEKEKLQRAFWEACQAHGKVGEVIYLTYKHKAENNISEHDLSAFF